MCNKILTLMLFLITFFIQSNSQIDRAPSGFCDYPKITPKNYEVYNIYDKQVNISNKAITSDIIVKKGSTLNLSGKIQLYGDVKIIVEQGAILNITNATLYSFSKGEFWHGIEVWGGTPAGLTAGSLNVTNSVFRDALLAILNSNEYNFYDPNYYDGKVNICGSTFDGNILDICLKNEKNIPIINTSTFENNNLTLGFGACFYFYPKGSSGSQTIHIFTQGGAATITSNSFHMTQDYIKYGIYSLDCSANIEANTFRNISLPIKTYTISTSRPNTIFNNSFFNCYNWDIESYGVNDNSIINNKSDFNEILTHKYGVMYLSNSENNKIESNNLSGNQENHITILDGGTMNNIIKSNIFSLKPLLTSYYNLNTFVNISGNHRFNKDGLSFQCNKFIGNNSNTVQNTGDIKSIIARGTSTSLLSADNTFENTKGSILNINLNNQGRSYSYYYQGLANSINLKYPISIKNVTRVKVNSDNCNSIIKPRPALSDISNRIPIIIKDVKINFCLIYKPIDIIKLEEFPIFSNLRNEIISNVNTIKNDLVNYPISSPLYQEKSDIISVLEAERDRMTDYLVHDQQAKRYYDPDDFNKNDLINLYYSYNNPYGDYQIADIYFSDKEYANCFATLNAMVAKYNLGGKELSNLKDLIVYFEFLKTKIEKQVQLDLLTSSDVAFLNNLASAESGRAKIRACNWLNFVGIESCKSPIANSLKSIATENANVAINDVKVYPIPMENILSIELDLKLQSDVHLSISDISGRVLYDSKNLTPKATIKVQTESWTKGLYILSIKDSLDKLILSKSIIK